MKLSLTYGSHYMPNRILLKICLICFELDYYYCDSLLPSDRDCGQNSPKITFSKYLITFLVNEIEKYIKSGCLLKMLS